MGWLVCVNLQHFVINEKQYRLTGIDVNINVQTSPYVALVDELAHAMPDLWGYAGIDLIETEEGIMVLEINPRLTSSYAGINKVCGINCAKEIISLLTGEPELNPINNRAIRINLTAEGNYDS
jgi:predicted ATP-grasp superfamily ATP-dependent carboligase